LKSSLEALVFICAVEGYSAEIRPEYKNQGADILGNKYNEINPYDVPKQPGNSQVMGANG